MVAESKYGVLRGIAGFFSIVGWVIVGLGVLVFIMSAIGSASSPLGGPGLLFGIVAGLSTCVSGLLIVGIGQALEVFVDIAVNTAPIAALVENSAATVAFFEHIKNKGQGGGAGTPAQPKAQNVQVDQGDYNGIRWRSFTDGSVIAMVDGQERRFATSADFMQFAMR